MHPSDHAFHLRFSPGRWFRREVSASAEIDAPIERVWATLVDFERYSAWNPFTPEVRAHLRVGEPIHMHVRMPRRAPRRMTEWINRIEPPRVLCWGVHLGARWLLCANRWQRLEPLDDRRTRYTTVDHLSGLLAPLVIGLYGEPMRRGFQAAADGLAAHLREERAA